MPVYTPKRLSQNQVTAAYVTQYTVPASTSAIVKEIIVANTTGYSATLDVSLVPSGGTAGATNSIIPTVAIPANSLVTFTFSQVLATGGFISAKAGTAAALTVTISGVEMVT